MSTPPDLSEIEAALRVGDRQRAADLAGAAVEAGASDPVLFRLKAEALTRAGDFDGALSWLERGVAAAPQDATMVAGLGRLLVDLDRHGEAIPIFQRAIAMDAGLAEAHFGLGESLGAFGEVVLARACFANALYYRQDYPEAEAALATLLARVGDPAAARRHAERVLLQAPGHRSATYALAAADVAEKQYGAAGLRLAALAADPNTAPVLRASSLCLQGDALHGQGRWRQAFDAWRRGKSLFRQIYEPTFAPAAQAAEALLDLLTGYFGAAPGEVWATAPEVAPQPTDPVSHVFLIGFNRSGTTLLEQVLAAHPDIVTVEERPLLLEAERAFMHTAQGLDALAGIEAETVSRYRAAYWRAVRALDVEPQGKVFVDKLPMNAANLPLIAKLFPHAKVLFALRDPRDVALSCFRHAFTMNGSNFLMLTPEGVAALYDKVMGLAVLLRDRLPLAKREVRYERLVEDFEAECRSVCAFLGLDWNPAMADFAERARERSIATPSAGQVREGLYRGGEGQWRAYREELGPVLPTLAPWVERFGYSAD
ncbi:MAG: sulfotransferase [Proteobacteria bacterium]|nr:sulfotransferase [Pseudomonadota bacterium]